MTPPTDATALVAVGHLTTLAEALERTPLSAYEIQTTPVVGRALAASIRHVLSLVAQGEADRERLCEWREPDGYHDDAWETTCGEAWTFLAGGVAENNVRFCHGCGGRVVAVPFVPAPDEDATPTEGPTHG